MDKPKLVFCAIYTLLLCTPTYCLDCYQCTNIQNVSDCNSLTQCNQDELCYTESTVTGTETRLTMGCRLQQVCQSSATTSLPSLALIGDVLNTLGCSQCCNTDACNKLICVPVNGQWSPWQHWSDCGVTCDRGTRTRERLCNNPAPMNGGQYCPWNGDETEMCYPRSCHIQGQWSRWSDWGHCSVSCGIGLERRDRTCSNPYPGPDGNSCLGDYHEDRACFIKACSDGQWSSWSDWSSCSVTCGTGNKRRTRTCSNPAPTVGGFQCPGSGNQSDLCGNSACSITPMTTHTPTTTTKLTTTAKLTTTTKATTITQSTPTTSKTTNPTSSRTTTTTQTTTPGFSTKQTTLSASTKALATVAHTTPPSPRTCFVCQKDAPYELCEYLYEETTCSPPNNYCINNVIITNDGSRSINRTCGNFDQCYRDWFLGSSDSDKCRYFDENNIITLNFECVYCCVEDRCNEKMNPPDNTLYGYHISL